MKFALNFHGGPSLTSFAFFFFVFDCCLFHKKACYLSARESSSVLLQSQTSPRPPNVGYRSNLTKFCTPTLGGQEDSKASQQF